jgi:predicted flap endonuclease-1-like 5' DNA nuclease
MSRFSLFVLLRVKLDPQRRPDSLQRTRRMPRPITRLVLAPWLGPSDAQRLFEAGVPDLRRLLRIARTPEGRAQLVRHTGIAEERILAWAHLADLCRVEGIGPRFATLLQQAGVTTLAHLAAADSGALAAVLETRTGRPGNPPRSVVERWIRGARKLGSGVHEQGPPPGMAWGRTPEGVPFEAAVRPPRAEPKEDE